MNTENELIWKISIVTQLGAETYRVGDKVDGETVDKIFMSTIGVSGDPFNHYCGFSESGKLLFTVNPSCPCVVEFLSINR